MTLHFHWPDGVPTSEHSREFLQGMLDRVAQSFFTYGKMSSAFPDKVNAIRTLRLRLDQYEQTGNTECLMEVANYAMIEFKHPAHPKAHFESTDSKQSPGRVWHGERTSKKDQND